MNQIIRAKIDVSKIDEARLFKGSKGTYLDITLLPNRDGQDQYGNDYMVVQDVSKEDWQAGVKGPILGNARNVSTQPKQAPRQSPPAPTFSPEWSGSPVPF